ncbi:hypothetical protein BP00DRAFT_28392 [Aspergillus indologenus CBS 114.80]|uniref:Uncharacterized protein n=1 Tax=Aspergillus indologenus CBS 114.80 TaxID=1450541 RepID=A0A2V5HS80_9EURO|nr:hypothetical protein BP00DRAFT_28392 [Aspergillus indologenus CBS 114.80]
MDGCFLSFSPLPVRLLLLPPSSLSLLFDLLLFFLLPPLLPSSLSHPQITDSNFLLNYILNLLTSAASSVTAFLPSPSLPSSHLTLLCVSSAPFSSPHSSIDWYALGCGVCLSTNCHLNTS